MKGANANRRDEGSRRALTLWAVDCAEHVVSLFEAKHPNDNRPRKAIEVGRAWVRGEVGFREVRTAALAAHAAARETEDPAARAAARAAGQAVATAHVAGHAPHAASYAVKAVVAAALPGNADAAAEAERIWQQQRYSDVTLPHASESVRWTIRPSESRTTNRGDPM